MADFKVGKVTHYFDKIGVAVLELTGNLAVGDTIKISRSGGDDFTMTVQSMQVEHEQIQEAKKGDTVGLKVDQSVKEDDEVYKVS
ncbi:MAG TPA: U32 family peptidase C-terminal domain-containing protein [Patescibacteria group bacterium]|nr:U32 family peptidase C-terminal domain-containing protein [Patescibacteria group bacterium]